MPSFLLSRNTPQNAASVPCSSNTRRSSPVRSAVISRRCASVGGVMSNALMGPILSSHRGEVTRGRGNASQRLIGREHRHRMLVGRQPKFANALAVFRDHPRRRRACRWTSERNIVVKILFAAGRRGGRVIIVSGGRAGAAAALAAAHAAGATASASQHLHIVGDDFGGKPVVSLLVLPLSCAQPALDEYLRSLAQVLGRDFS